MAAIPFRSDIDLNGNKLLNPAFEAGAIPLSALSTDPLARTNHTGTQAASTISDFDTQVRTSRLDQMAAPTADVSFNSQKLTNLATPVATTDGANKQYVDDKVNGTKWLAPVAVATTGAITLSGEQTIDGVVTNATRILVKNQGNSENGIYTTGVGAWTRTADLASGVDAANVSVFVQGGTTLADTQWICTNNTGSAVVGTATLVFAQFGASTSYSADESTLTLSGTTFSVKSGGIGNTQLAAGAALANIGAGGITDSYLASTFTKKHSENFGNGVLTSFTITHNLGTKDVIVQVRNNSTDAFENFTIVATTTSAVTISCNVAPTTNAYRAIVIG